MPGSFSTGRSWPVSLRCRIRTKSRFDQQSIWKTLQQRFSDSSPTEPVQAFLDHGVDFVVEDSLTNLVNRMNKLPKKGGPSVDVEQIKREIEIRDDQVENKYSKDAQIMLIRNAFWNTGPKTLEDF